MATGDTDQVDVVSRGHPACHLDGRHRRAAGHVVPALLQCVGDAQGCWHRNIMPNTKPGAALRPHSAPTNGPDSRTVRRGTVEDVTASIPGVVAAIAADELSNERAMARLGVALAIGLLVGLQRQFAKQRDSDDLFAGARSFALIGLAGAMSSLLAERFDNVIVFASGFVVVGVIVAVGYLGGIRDGSVGLTTEIAAIVTFLAGALAGIGDLTVATATAVATTALLAAKPYTREFVRHLDRQDVEATLQFAVLVALVLPVLPRDPLGSEPFDAASPFKIGLMVVFILGLSFLGYVLIKIVGPRRGIGLTGVLGGLVSSTAVTLTMSERSKSSAGLLRALAMAVLLAWTIMYGRVLVEVGVVNPGLLRQVVLPIGVGGLCIGAWAVFVSLRRTGVDDGDGTDEERFSNPFSLGPALQFGLLYGAVLIGSKAMSMYLGDAGVYVGALASGIADVDAITLSMAELSRGDGSVSNATAANAIVLAAASNTLVKGGLVWVLSTPAMRKLVAPAVIAAVATSVCLTFAV